MKNKYLISIVGPTAIGKTARSIAVAQYFNTEIISSDSRQFYKEMSIGTAVPEPAERDAVEHHFIQNRSVFEDYSVGDFERDALKTLSDLFTQKDVVVMVGGSGLYVDAVLKGLDHFPEVNPSIRKELNRQLEEKGISGLQEQLKKYDPVTFEKIDIHNPQRLTRALEICIGTGKPYSSFLNQTSRKRDFIPVKIGLTAEREIIYRRINERVDIMIENGLLEEARKLYPHKELNALQTVGYRELFRYFDGEWSLEFAISEIKKNTRRFAKRQLTWFRKDPEITWFDYRTPDSEIFEFLQKHIQTA